MKAALFGMPASIDHRQGAMNELLRRVSGNLPLFYQLVDG